MSHPAAVHDCLTSEMICPLLDLWQVVPARLIRQPPAAAIHATARAADARRGRPRAALPLRVLARQRDGAGPRDARDAILGRPRASGR
eukprot:1598780-Prymnesium_polylepis.1